MYPDDLAERFKKRAGEKWRPSNGTEGEIFMEEYCRNCLYDSDESYCPLIGVSMAYDVKDDLYPVYWQYREDGQPTCVLFSSR